MIEVRFRVFKTGDFKFSCKGHAGAGERGHDLVCAAASALAYGLIENLEQSEEMLLEGHYTEDDGVLKAEFKPKAEFVPSLMLLFRAKFNEFKALERGHEDYIKVFGNGDAR